MKPAKALMVFSFGKKDYTIPVVISIDVKRWAKRRGYIKGALKRGGKHGKSKN